MELFGVIDALADFGWLIKTYGPLLFAVIFFIWRDYRREDRLTRIKQLEDEQREIILPLIQQTTEVVVRNTTVMQQSTRVMERLEHALK